jgi:hypothetical protein
VRSLMAAWTEHDKMPGIVAVQQVAGEVDGMELQHVNVLAALRAEMVGLFAQRILQAAHLRIMNYIQAGMKEQASEDKSQQPRAQAHGQEQEQAQKQWMVEVLYGRWRIGLQVEAHGCTKAQGAVSDRMPEVVVDIDKNTAGKRDQNVLLEPGSGNDGSRRREFYVFLHSHVMIRLSFYRQYLGGRGSSRGLCR